MNALVAVTVINEAQCFERLVSLLEHDVLQESARHQRERLTVTHRQVVLLRLCVIPVIYYEQPQQGGTDKTRSLPNQLMTALSPHALTYTRARTHTHTHTLTTHAHVGKEERVHHCLQRLCSTTVAEFLVASLHDGLDFDQLGFMMWLALSLYHKATNAAPSGTLVYCCPFTQFNLLHVLIP
jgi:hypothetical protein